MWKDRADTRSMGEAPGNHESAPPSIVAKYLMGGGGAGETGNPG